MKAEFRSRCVVEVDDEPHYFVLTEPLTFYSAIFDKEVTAPAGYRTNFASIPRLFQAIIQVNGRHRKAAVIHDYLCDLIDRQVTDWTLENMTQGKADKIFREAMKVLDVDFVESSVMYRMVRRYQKTMAWIKGENY